MHNICNIYATYLDIYTSTISNYKHTAKIILFAKYDFRPCFLRFYSFCAVRKDCRKRREKDCREI